MIQIDCSYVTELLPPDWRAAFAPRLEAAHRALEEGTGPGASFTGWLRLPETYDRDELERIKNAARRMQGDSEALVVIGIGGSYLGARGAIELLCSPHYNLKRNGMPQLFFCGNTLSADAVSDLLDVLRGRDFSVNVISKSGTTTEPAVAFRLFRTLLEERYGREAARRRIYVTTDKTRGALRAMADREGYESFSVPDEIGGRYSVLTAVGLLPMAVAGIDLDAVLAGAGEAMEQLSRRDMENPAWQYAAARNALYESGRKIEALACYEPSFRFMTEWWKQLFGESEGKDGRGIFPAGLEFPADLHSMGQYLQEGERILFETVVRFARAENKILIPEDPSNEDGFGFLSGCELAFAARQAMDGTLLAHTDGGVPNLIIHVPGIDAHSFGALVYFFELACGLSGYVLGINPFDQPGVEQYKKNMAALLGKPGCGALKAELLKRMEK